jgi:hypothetical protein
MNLNAETYPNYVKDNTQYEIVVSYNQTPYFFYDLNINILDDNLSPDF